MDAMMRLVSRMSDDKRFDIRLEAAMAKLFCTEESWKALNDTIQIRGGRGYETAPSLKGRGTAAYPLERAMRDSRVNTILEGSSEIMHLFIAREALDFHLNKIKLFLDPKIPVIRKLFLVISVSIGYALWYIGLWLPSFGGKGLAKPLDSHMVFVRRTSRRLARTIFHKMMVYQQKLVQKQNVLNRLVDIGTDLFAMSCASAYAASLAQRQDGAGLAAKDKGSGALELADLFCRKAQVRIARNFRDVSHNDDRLSNHVAKRVLAGDYEWLEDDIIKGR